MILKKQIPAKKLDTRIFIRVSKIAKDKLQDQLQDTSLSDVIRTVLNLELIQLLKKNNLDVPETLKALLDTFSNELKEYISKKHKLPKRLKLNLLLSD